MSKTGTTQPLQFRVAGSGDAARLREFIGQLYDEDRIPMVDDRVARGIAALLADRAHGEALFWLDDAGNEVGYSIMTLCFSVEQGGVYALLDELYLAPPVRGRGHASRILAAVAERARARGCERMYLEVNRHNTDAARLYLANGYVDIGRGLLALTLDGPVADRAQ